MSEATPTVSRVLVVDVDAVIRRMFERLLTKRGYSVHTEEGGRSAVAALAEESFDVVMLDQMMADMDGLDVLERIKSRWPGLPVIMMTAYGSVHLATTFMKRGGADFIEKPIDLDVTEVKIRRAIANARAEEELRQARYAMRRAESQLRDNERQLADSKKLAAIGQLAAGVAHELSQPLNHINLTCQLLEKMFNGNGGGAARADVALKGEILDEVETITANVERAVDIIRLMGRLAEEKPAAIDRICVSKVLQDTVDRHASRFAARGVKLVFVPPDEALLAMGVSEMLGQVVGNVLANARDAFEGDGGESKLVDLRVEELAETVRVVIADNGPGMARAQVSQIFNPFFTTKAPGQGVGLGLSISHKIIQDFGGDLSVQSEEGQGTTVTLTLRK